MPDRQRVEQFIAAVVSGDHVSAIADFYHENASMQENDEAPRSGRAFLMAHEEEALKRVKRMDTFPVETFLVDGDRVVIQWVFEIVDLKGLRRRFEELSLQKWNGDRIQTERFFYDTAKKWAPVTS